MYKLKEIIGVWSIKLALYQQKLLDYYKFLKTIVGDDELLNQYTDTKIDTEYLKVNVRALHSFQSWLFVKGVGLSLRILLKETSVESKIKPVKIVDLGDSSGNHIRYFKSIIKNISSLSINCDKNACERIKEKGYPYLNRTIEDFINLYWYVLEGKYVTMFEVLEHLENPVEVLRTLKNKNSKKIVLTVPYLKNSRIGMDYLRNGKGGNTKEDVHIFELSPEDWKLLFKYCGWNVEYEEIYYQYPRRMFFISTILKYLWKKIDYEGFYGVILN